MMIYGQFALVFGPSQQHAKSVSVREYIISGSCGWFVWTKKMHSMHGVEDKVSQLRSWIAAYSWKRLTCIHFHLNIG